MAGISHYQLPLPTFDAPVRLLIVVSPYYREIADNLIGLLQAYRHAALVVRAFPDLDLRRG